MEMPRRIRYRRRLLQAVDAFLEGTPSSLVRAQDIIQRCDAALHSDAKEATLDQIIWDLFIRTLGDSVFYQNEAYLREAQKILLGHSSQSIARTGISEDFRSHFTLDEAEWHAQLMSLADFLIGIPFAEIHEATYQVWQSKDTWATMRKVIPEAIQAEKVEAEYRQRKSSIEAIAAQCPPPEDIGDEKIYHLVLREVTNLLTGIAVGGPAVYCGYPILAGPFTAYGDATDLAPGISAYVLNMSESLVWAKRALEALIGKGGLLISCRLSTASTFDADMLIITLY